MTNSKSKKKGGDAGTILVSILAVLAVIAVIILLLRGCGNTETPEDNGSKGPGIVYDSEAVVGGWNEADLDAIVQGLNEKVEEGMINISMNTSPCFENGSSAGNLMIVNDGVNRYPQVRGDPRGQQDRIRETRHGTVSRHLRLHGHVLQRRPGDGKLSRLRRGDDTDNCPGIKEETR